MTRADLSHMTAEERRRHLLDQARDCKRRRRQARRDMLEQGAVLCKYGWPRLCLGTAMVEGYCRHHARKMEVL